MSRRRAALGSFLASLSARAVRSLARVGVLLIAARLYPIEEVGEFAFVLGVGTLTAGLLDFGVTMFIQREVGALGFESAHLERQAFRIRLATLPISVLLGLSIISSTGSSLSAVGTLGFTAALALADFLAGLRRARGQFRREALEVAPVLLGGVGAGLAVGLAGGGLAEFQWALGVGALALTPRAILLRAELARRTPASGSNRRSPLVGLVWHCRWFWLAGVGAVALFELPIVLLRILADPKAVALYASAMRAVGLVSQPLLVLGGTFVPSMAFQAREARPRYLDAVLRLNTIYMAATPIGLVLAVIGGALLLRSFGEQYLQALNVLWVLALGTLLYLGPPYAGTLIIEQRERQLAGLVALAAIVTAALCVLLVPTGGALGAAISAVGGFALGKTGHVLLYRRSQLPLLVKGGLAAGLGIAAWAAAAFLAPFPIDWVILIVGGGVGALAASSLLRRTALFHVTD